MTEASNKKFWERAASIYTLFMNRSNKKLFEALCKKIEPLFHENTKVLELACGTGQLTFRLSKCVASWTATDFSENMIKEAKKRSKNNKIHFEVQDATALPYENELFDVVLIANALHIMPNPEKALAEIKRVLKPNGILIAPTFVYDGKINKRMIWMMEKLGFKTFHKWKAVEYMQYVEENGYHVIKKAIIPGKMLSECVLVCKKK